MAVRWIPVLCLISAVLAFRVAAVHKEALLSRVAQVKVIVLQLSKYH